jgi:ankyrin repeat protein
LHLALAGEDETYWNISIIRMLFEKTTNLNHKNLLDETPFDLAMKSGNADIINLFKRSDKKLDGSYTPKLFKTVSLPEITYKTESELLAANANDQSGNNLKFCFKTN